MKILSLAEESGKAALKALLGRGSGDFSAQEETVKEIIQNVRDRGDAAVFEYTEKFDGVSLDAESLYVSEEEIRQASSEHQTRASTKLWTIPLSGDALSKDFSVTSSYPYAKVWIQNSGTGNIVFTITKNSPTGTLVTGSNVTVAANTSISVYSTNPWPAATYYANFTSGHVNMLGTSSCRIASTISELDI